MSIPIIKKSPGEIKKAISIPLFNTTKQQYEPIIFPNGLKVGLTGDDFNRGIELVSNNAPSVTTNRLYNENGALKFNGGAIGSGGGTSFWTEGSAGKIYTTGSAGVGTSAASKTAFTVSQDYATVTFENQLADGEGGGNIIKYGTGTTVAGELYYLDASGAWYDTDANTTAVGGQLIAVALGTNPSSDGMLLSGFARIGSSLINGTPAIGSPVYISTTTGEYDFTRPSASGEFVRVVGYCLDIHTSDILLYFNPDPTWVEIS